MATFSNGRSAGRLVATSGALAAGVELGSLIRRHLACDWGEMPAEDKVRNDQMLHSGGMLMSAYTVEGVTIWVITDPGHAVTTVLLPSEY